MDIRAKLAAGGGMIGMLASAALAQSAPLREMATDRPNVTNTPTTIDAGRMQIEFGAGDRTVDREGGMRERTTSVAEPNFRLGVTDALEVNLIVRPFASMAVRDAAGARGRTRGFGDTSVGAKLNFSGNDGGATALAAQLQVNLPTAKGGLGAGAVEVGLSLPFTVVLPAGFGLSLQPTFSRAQSDARRAVTGYQAAVAIDHDVGPVNLYAEYVGDETSARAAPATHVLNLGGEAAVTDALMLDAGAGLGLNRAADDFRFLTGLSVRF